MNYSTVCGCGLLWHFVFSWVLWIKRFLLKAQIHQSINSFFSFFESAEIHFDLKPTFSTVCLAPKNNSKINSAVAERCVKISTAVTEQSCLHHACSQRSSSFELRRQRIPPAARHPLFLSWHGFTFLQVHHQFCSYSATTVQYSTG